MANKTITAANSVYTLVVPLLFPVPQQLEGYSADAAFDTDASESAEVVKGVDGKMSAGYIPFMTRQNISLMPDSPSVIMFEDWIQAQKARRDVLFCYGTISLPSIQRKYTMTKGVMTSTPIIPGVRRVLQARTFTITWDSIDPTPFLG